MLSVVVPTHNRAESAVRLAEALDRQVVRAQVESTFVLDGCIDNTREALMSLRLRHSVNIVETGGVGAAAARNRGAEASSGNTLLFIDDDVVPQPGMLAAHMELQRSKKRLLAVGPYPYAPEMAVNPLDFAIRGWWQERFADMARRDHEFTYEDCVTGNLSLPREDFDAVGGFDECFEKDGREDYELGARLLKSGMRMTFAADALAYHYPTNRPRSSLRKWYTFGRADIRMATKHPDLFDSLLLNRWWPISPCSCTWSRLGLSACANHKAAINLLGWYFERNLASLWQPRYWQLWECSKSLTYFMGATSACGGKRGLKQFVERCMGPDCPERSMS